MRRSDEYTAAEVVFNVRDDLGGVVVVEARERFVHNKYIGRGKTRAHDLDAAPGSA